MSSREASFVTLYARGPCSCGGVEGGIGAYNEIGRQNEHISMYVHEEWAMDGAIAFWSIECEGKHTFSGGDSLTCCALYASFGKSIQRFRRGKSKTHSS